MKFEPEVTNELIKERIIQVTQSKVGEQLGLGESQMNRIMGNKNGIKLFLMGPLFDALNLKLVDIDAVVVERKDLDAVQHLAYQHIKEIKPTIDDVTVSHDEYNALVTLAGKYLKSTQEDFIEHDYSDPFGLNKPFVIVKVKK